MGLSANNQFWKRGLINRPKNIPHGIFLSIAIIISLYLLANLAYYKVLGFDDLRTKVEIIQIIASKMFGKQVAAYVIIFICTAG